MNKVNALWLKNDDSFFSLYSLADLMDEYTYIGYSRTGFGCTTEERYMICTGILDDLYGCALTISGVLMAKEEQVKAHGDYFVFDSAKELYLWMAEGEK